MTAEEIKQIRKSLALTQAEFARELKVTPVTVGCWEIGLKTPNSTSVKKIKMLEEEREKNIIDLEDIEKLRIRKNLSQEQFAKLVGIKQQTYGAWLRGIAKPSPKSVRKLVEVKNKLTENRE